MAIHELLKEWVDAFRRALPEFGSIPDPTDGNTEFRVYIDLPHLGVGPQSVCRVYPQTVGKYRYDETAPLSKQRIHVQTFDSRDGPGKTFGLRNVDKAAAYAGLVAGDAIRRINATKKFEADSAKALKPIVSMCDDAHFFNRLVTYGPLVRFNNGGGEPTVSGEVRYNGTGRMSITLTDLTPLTARRVFVALAQVCEEPDQFDWFGPNDEGLEPPTG